MGLCGLPLRSLDAHPRHVGMGAGAGAGRGPITRRRLSRSSAAATSRSRSPAVTLAAVAWFPLGPREVYRPSYAVSRGYFENVNRSNTVINTTRDQQLLQQHERDQCRLCKSTGTGCGRRRADGHVRAIAARERAAVRVSPAMVASAPVATVPPLRRPSAACAARAPQATSRRRECSSGALSRVPRPLRCRWDLPHNSNNSQPIPASRSMTPHAGKSRRLHRYPRPP